MSDANAPVAPTRPAISKVWAQGRIEIVREIGAGGMGVVYEAIDRERNMRVAVKTLQRMDPDALVLFKREFRVLQDTHHENLVQYGELFEENGVWFFTMELLDGVDLFEYVCGATSATRHTYDDARLRRVFEQLTRGLVDVHRAGKVHRDIKPSNVLVTREGRAVILDFGVAADANGALNASMAGTAPFMAPEQALCEPLGPAADVYAVGSTLYLALTGRTPFVGSHMDVLSAKIERLPPRPREVNPAVPPELDELCMSMLALAPEDRPRAFDILRRLGSEATSAPPDSVPPPSDLFVGRARELDALRAAFAGTRRGETSVLLVNGVSGVGKSALVRQFSTEVRSAEPSTLTASGRCYERESVPYKAVDELLDALSAELAALPPSDALPSCRRTSPSSFACFRRSCSSRRSPRRRRARPASSEATRRRCARAYLQRCGRCSRRSRGSGRGLPGPHDDPGAGVG